MTSFSAKPRPVVLIVVFPDTMLLDVAGPAQVFSQARRVGGEDYDIVLVSDTGEAQLSDTGVELATEPMERWRGRDIHTLLIAGGWGAEAAARNQELIDGIRALACSATRIGSVCTGALILAACGLLDGRRAVTHWYSCDTLASHHPGVSLEPDRIFVRDGHVWTSAGVTAGIDMALAMIAEDSGRKLAVHLAKGLVMYMVRPGGQSQFSPTLLSQTRDASGRFDTLHDWLSQHLHEDLRVDQLADVAGMSERNFARVYREVTGVTPAKAIERMRVAAARNLLEETTLPISAIARRTGFQDDERLRRAIRRAVGVSPVAYRERFGIEGA